MGKSPASQFYWADWRKDPGIRACSFETRGIWFEILCIMWESENRGFFILNGVPPDDVTASRMIGCTLEQYKNSVLELERNKVMSQDCHACMKRDICVTQSKMSKGMSQDCHGVIFNRRMVREANLHKAWRERQARHRKNVTQKSPSSHALITPLSSSSSSIINNKEKSFSNVTPLKYYKNELNNFVCSLCQKSFIQYKNLQTHFSEEHK